MSAITYDYMESYIKSLISDREGVLGELEEYAHSNSVPIVQKEVAKFLEVMVTIKKPARILELGTAIGYSAMLMKECSPESHIITMERDPVMVKLACENFKKYGFEDSIEILEGDCLELMEGLQGSYDFIFLDAGKGHYNHLLPHLLRVLSKEGIIVADNVLFRGMVASKELLLRRKITIVKRMKKYLDLVSKDEHLITTVIPMGDGIAVTTRRN